MNTGAYTATVSPPASCGFLSYTCLLRFQRMNTGVSTVAFAFEIKATPAIAITPKSAISENDLLMSCFPNSFSFPISLRSERPSARDPERDLRTAQHTVQ